MEESILDASTIFDEEVTEILTEAFKNIKPSVATYKKKVVGKKREVSLAEALNTIKEQDKERVKRIISNSLSLENEIKLDEHLIWTNQIIETTHKIYLEMFLSGRGVFFDEAHKKIEEQVGDLYSWTSKKEIEYLVYADLLLFLEEHYLTNWEKKRLRSVYPDKTVRAKAFADYMWENAHKAKSEGDKDRENKKKDGIFAIFDKLIEAFKKFLFGEYFVFCLFEDIKNGKLKARWEKTNISRQEKAEKDYKQGSLRGDVGAIEIGNDLFSEETEVHIT